MTQLISRCRQRKLRSNLTNGITQQFDVRTHSKLSELSKKGRTTKLWMTYHTLVLSLQKETIIMIYTWQPLLICFLLLPLLATHSIPLYQRRTIICSNNATKYNNIIYLCRLQRTYSKFTNYTPSGTTNLNGRGYGVWSEQRYLAYNIRICISPLGYLHVHNSLRSPCYIKATKP